MLYKWPVLYSDVVKLQPHWTLKFFTSRKGYTCCTFCTEEFVFLQVECFDYLREHIVNNHNHQYDVYLNGISHEEPDHGDYFISHFFYITKYKTVICKLCDNHYLRSRNHFLIWKSVLKRMEDHIIKKHYNKL